MEKLLEALTLESIRLHLGLEDGDTSRDARIMSIRDKIAPLLIEDAFTWQELSKLTANQRERAVYGLGLIIAAEVIQSFAVGGNLGAIGGSSGESIRVGPLQFSSNEGASVSASNNLNRSAGFLRKRGEDILDELRLYFRATLGEWGVV